MQAISTDLTRHGGRMDHAMRLYPQAPTPWLDLSTGINPLPWSSADRIDVDARSLPSRDALYRLEAAAARHFGVDPSRVAAIPGSEIALRTLGLLNPPRPITRLEPCYGTYAAVADEAFPAAALGSIPRGGTVLLANPNNPDGALRNPCELLDLARSCATQGGWLVLDEAFADASPGASIAPLLDVDDPVVVLRSFGKFFGLAGLRLGFAIAPAFLINRVRSLFGDWPVSAHAIALGTAAYEDEGWIAGTLADLPERARRLDALLGRHGLIGQGACPLFRLVECPDATSLFHRLAAAGILTRPFASYPTWLRFGLPGSDAAFSRLDQALANG